MRKRGGLKGLFNRFAAATVLSAGLLAGTAAAQEQVTPPAQEQTVIVGCPAFPDFKMPDGPMHRVPRDRTPNPDLRTQQTLIKALDLMTGAADGFGGGGTRAGMREFLLFYAPLYQGDANKFTLDSTDTAQLRKYAAEAQKNAQTYRISTAQAAALSLASGRTGVSMATLAKNTGHKFENATWLYMVKNYGASYGMEFHASHIVADEQGKLSVDNPFIHRQILELKDHPRVLALMTAEYLKNKDSIPAAPAIIPGLVDEAVRAQQKDLATLGFDVGKSADGIKGEMTRISIGEYQLLYGDGAATGTLNAGEIAALSAQARRAKEDGADYNAPALAAGAVRMAADKHDGDFAYMMKLAAAESSYIHDVRATTSSATGLFQFIEGTWGYMVLNYGEKHGLGDFKSQVEIYKDDLGREQTRIANPLIRRGLLELRANPQVSALFGADFQAENKAKEACYVPGALNRTDLYLAHFLGASDAVWFLTELKKNPDQSAVATFPEAAAYNVNVFYARQKGAALRERSLQEVYNIFARKFDEQPVIAAVPAAMKPVPKRKHRG
jgi:peptidoglycan hydrolase-like protein with peptidoglycan-binding domain